MGLFWEKGREKGSQHFAGMFKGDSGLPNSLVAWKCICREDMNLCLHNNMKFLQPAHSHLCVRIDFVGMMACGPNPRDSCK